MPFASVHRPAIGVSLLKAGLRRIGIFSRIHYFNLNFEEIIGLRSYDRIAETEFAGSSLVGELIFAKSAFSENNWSRQHISTALGQIYKSSDKRIEEITSLVTELQNVVPSFLRNCTSDIISENPDVIGFTSTFHQNCASIALAKSIKSKANIPIIFGGANCEGEMGFTLLKCVPWIDFICSGEGDIAFIEFMRSFLRGKPLNDINGIVTRDSSVFHRYLTNPVMNMDSLPIPDFVDFFATFKRSPVRTKFRPDLTIETSRGCWWGEKSQCTFCGLNGSTMKYRSKSIPRALNELKYLVKTYGIRRFSVVDNILDLKYIDGLFSEIYHQGMNIDLFYETKSNLTKEQLIIMKRGGVNRIQPGIESLSTHVLQIMKKGVSALQNIQILKWCREIHIIPYWNLIWGFPGESEIEYVKMARILPLLMHFHPPYGFGNIVLDRFSPYFVEPLKYGLLNIRPSAAYKFAYPFSDHDLNKLAYHFEFDYCDGRKPESYTKKLKKQIVKWKDLWNNPQAPVPSLNIIYNDRLIMINDSRPCSKRNFYMFSDEEAEIYKICENIHSLQSIMLRIRRDYPSIEEEFVMKSLSNFMKKKLMLHDGDKFLSLAVEIKR
jgi:ribosomal peptide maturation radical SAM protein 1